MDTHTPTSATVSTEMCTDVFSVHFDEMYLEARLCVLHLNTEGL